MKTTSWLVVANASAARFYNVKNMDELTEINTLIHPASRLPEQELVSSKPGRTFESTGQRRHAMEPKTSQKKTEFEQFAKTISEHLETSLKKDAFSRLYIAAGPSFLGTLRKTFHPQILELITKEISKDLVHAEPKQLLEELFG